MRIYRLAHLLLLLLPWMATPARAEEITVFAAASLNDALKELASRFEAQSKHKVLFNFGASSLLARQLGAGAPGDLFFSADEEKMDSLERKGLIVSGSRKSVLSNTLVLAVETNSPLRLDGAMALRAAGIRRLAIAEPQTVPAGIYAKSWLQRCGLWDELAGKVIPTENVRAALFAVEGGNADVAIIYKTDALISKRVRIAYEVPVKETPGISYPVALLKGSKVPVAARELLTFLSDPSSLRVFERDGFLIRAQAP